MGQYRLSRRIARQRHYQGIELPIVAPCYKDSEVAVIRLTRKQLIKNQISLGIYLIEIIGEKSIRFIRELREVKDPYRIDISIPKDLSDAFNNRQRVNVTLKKLNRDGFFNMVKDSMTQLYCLDKIEMKDDKLLLQIEGKELEFIISSYGYQQQRGYTGAYLTFEGPLPAKQSFKISSDRYDKPHFLISYYKNDYKTIVGVSYDPELLLFNVNYKHHRTIEHTKRIRLGELISNTTEIRQHFERYFQAKSKGMSCRMGAEGTAIGVEILKDMGYKVVWADTISGNIEGPDISLFDDYGNKITAEVKSTSNSKAINKILDKAIYDIETYYFYRTYPKFLWHSESDELEYEADYALAIAINLDKFRETVDMKGRKIKALVNDEGVKFERIPLTWRKEQIE